MFWQKKIFFLVLSRATSFEFLAPCQNLEKTNDPVPRKHQGRGKDGQTVLCRIRRATAAGPINFVIEGLAE